MTLPSAPIAEHVNVSEDICMSQIPGFVDPFSDALLFSELKQDRRSETVPLATGAFSRFCGGHH
ncbi:hypothetical protein [Citrobacter sp. Cm046]|uniref:hypothetical protein n=1 Tax=Citrobacter sp. Cm046 TaxID=2985118 RepID=UPI0025791006|nr:hypothetical protein [Citrobacter sp. Cm046]MDM2930249.1 hypothetical protein [Citrobacter sp. Cm046]